MALSFGYILISYKHFIQVSSVFADDFVTLVCFFKRATIEIFTFYVEIIEEKNQLIDSKKLQIIKFFVELLVNRFMIY